MTKRLLTKEEKSAISISLLRLHTEVEYMEIVELGRKEFAIKVAPLEYSNQLKEMEREKKRLTSDVKEIKKAIKILEIQMREGVEIKNEKQSNSENSE